VNFIAFVFALAVMSGPGSFSRGFDSKEECEKFIAEVRDSLDKHNRGPSDDKVSHFGAACVEVKKAPSGAV